MTPRLAPRLLLALVTVVSLGSLGPMAGCVPAAGYGTYGAASAPPTATTTGVYLNGQELTVAQKAELDDFLGETLPQGRYTVDADGNLGFEGQAPRVNLVALARQREAPRGKQPMNLYSRDSAGNGSSIVSDGNCTILSTPDGSLSSGC